MQCILPMHLRRGSDMWFAQNIELVQSHAGLDQLNGEELGQWTSEPRGRPSSSPSLACATARCDSHQKHHRQAAGGLASEGWASNFDRGLHSQPVKMLDAPRCRAISVGKNSHEKPFDFWLPWVPCSHTKIWQASTVMGVIDQEMGIDQDLLLYTIRLLIDYYTFH